MQFLTEHSNYVTMIIATMILVGIILYLSRIDARLRRVELDVERDSDAMHS